MPTTMPSHERLDVVRAVYRAIAAQDVDALTALTDPEVHIYQSETLPYGGHHHGYPGLATFLAGVARAIDSTVETGPLFVAGEDVVQVGRTHGVARATGIAFDSAEVHIWRLRGGRVIGLSAYVDTDAVVQALGPRRPDRPPTDPTHPYV